ncbi:MAG: DNA polymerase III subunit chi [Nitrosomonadales bacterium]|nr:MAG: DNA polymerase III subunit chi [Nitrosomonadales bacterium]
MTQIDFYTHVQDRQLLACKLSAKALEQGLRVLVLTSDESDAARMDRMLWSVPATGFLPHCRARDELAPATPVIVDHDPGELAHEQVLLNLSGTKPAFFSRFQRLIEIVTADEADREAARERFRFYRDRGYEIRSHDMSQIGKRHS